LKIIDFIKNNTNWKNKLLDEFGISTKQDHNISENYASLVYDQIASPKTHNFTRECRGVIIDTNNLNVVSRPFDRFFNYGEFPEETKTIDFNNATYFDKLDGSIVTFYYSEEHKLWKVSTKSTPFSRNAITKNRIPFLSLISETLQEKDSYITVPENENYVDTNLYYVLIDKINSVLDPVFNKNYSYICELTSPHNTIVTQYKETEINLLAVRDKNNGAYIENHNPLPKLFKNPKSYNIKSLSDLMEFINKINKGRETLLEGVVVMDNKTKIRAKIKNSAYLKVHKLMNKDIDEKSILSIVADQEEDEFLIYYPNLKNEFKPYVEAREKGIQTISDGIKIASDITDRKLLANTLKKMNVMPFIFLAIKNNVNNERVAFSSIGVKNRVQLIKDFL
jgi:RNA ligase